MNSQKFLAFDGMRGIAALMVLTRHTESYFGGSMFYHSYLAVDLFFALSGFVISHAYGQKMHEGRTSSLDFMKTRWIRLYPLFFLGAVLDFAVALTFPTMHSVGSASVQSLSLSLFLTLLFLPSRVPGGNGLFPINGPGWSLFFEMVVNAIYAFIQRWLSVPVLTIIIAGSAIVLGAVAVYAGGTNIGYTWSTRSVLGGFARSMFGIFLGILLHRIYKKRSVNSRLTIASWIPPSIVTLVLLLPKTGLPDWVVDLGSIFIVFPVCLYIGAFAVAGQRSRQVLSFLGVISYPIYLLHMPVSVILSGILAAPLKPYAPLGGIVLAVGLCGLAVALDRYYDRPLRKALTGMAGRMSFNRVATSAQAVK